MKTYEPRNTNPVEAVQWDGSRHQAQEIISWIQDAGCRADFISYGPGWPDRIQFTDGEGIDSLEPNFWVVKTKTAPSPFDDDKMIGVFAVMNMFDFENAYKEPDA